VEVQVDAGVVRLALTNYTGVLFLSQTAPGPSDGPGDSAAALSAAAEARAGKRRSRDCPPQTPDPADALTIKKLKGLKAHNNAGEEDGEDGGGEDGDDAAAVSAAVSDHSAAGLDLECLAHVYEQLDAAASSQLAVLGGGGGPAPERGVFALLGNGRNPGKTGAVAVSASGYDPGMKRPEDLTGGAYCVHCALIMPTLPRPSPPDLVCPRPARTRPPSRPDTDSAFIGRGQSGRAPLNLSHMAFHWSAHLACASSGTAGNTKRSRCFRRLSPPRLCYI